MGRRGAGCDILKLSGHVDTVLPSVCVATSPLGV